MPNRTRLRLEHLDERIVPASLLPPGFTEQVIVTGLPSPTTMSLAPDGRIFVALQHGEVRVIQDGNLLPTPFLTVSTIGDGERGLVGFALDPNFQSNGYVYAYYLVPALNGSDEFNRVSRFTANGNAVVPGSEVVLMNLDPLIAPAGSFAHNGGAMHFGNDGKLYIATGDNVDPMSSQRLDSLRGKILRINPDGTIPADNPSSFQGVSGTTQGIYRAIYAIGLRNPFTFSVQPGTGRIFVNDVGQDTWEEINELLPGRNYGWPLSEGPTSNPNFTGPIFAYLHGFSDDTGLAVTGGVFYNPATANFPSQYVGDYFFADFVGNYIKSYDLATGQATMFAKNLTKGGVIDLDVANNGDLYYLARGGEVGNDAGIYRIRQSNQPAIAVQPGGRRLAIGESVTLSVQANGAGPLRYQWTRNGFDVFGATGSTLTLTATAADDQATFRVVVSNDFGTIVSTAATLTVTQSKPPSAEIITPTDRFVAGETYTFEGRGIDPETGVLPGSALTWIVDYHTGSAPPRPFVPATTGQSVTFTIPTQTPYTLPDVFYRITLTTTDPDGIETRVTRDLLPFNPTITVAASAPGVEVLLDGQPVGQTHVFTGVSGVDRTLSVPESVEVDGEIWPFMGWFDGETSPSRTISTPLEATTYLAVYKRTTPVAAGIAVAPGAGGGPLVRVFQPDGQLSAEQFAFNPNLRTGISVALADFTGDGVPDLIAGSGRGEPPRVTIFDGATGVRVKTYMAFEEHFLGGVSVGAADFDGDGKAELIVTPGFGGGPRVRVLHAQTGEAMFDFFGIADPSFRGGARAVAGDVDGDGVPDLLVAAGEGGGPRISGWSGAALMDGRYERLFGDFFAFDPALRSGAFISAADLNGDGRADLVLGAGTGGSPHVVVKTYLGLERPASIGPDPAFFAGDTNGRGGIRVLARDLDGDGVAEIITASGAAGATISVFDANGKPLEQWNAFAAAFPGGVFVG